MASGNRTLVELASGLGLSKTTVADALRGSGRVSEATRERVRQAALDAGYVSNRNARQLRTRTSETLGLYIAPDVRNMPFYMPFAFGVTEAASHSDFDVTLIARSSARVGESWDHLGGAIVIDTLATDSVVASLANSSIPIVSAGRVKGSIADSFAAVVEIEHAKACREALDALERQGATRPALVAPDVRDAYSWSQQLRDGYLGWCRERAIEPVVVSLPPFPTNELLEEKLQPITSDQTIDTVLFGWREIADRALLLLDPADRGRGNRIRVATLTSTPTVGALDTFDAEVDLRPLEFGKATAEVLLSLIRAPGSGPRHQLHQPRVTARTTTADPALPTDSGRV